MIAKIWETLIAWSEEIYEYRRKTQNHLYY